MPKFKVDLMAKLVGFHEVEIEAENEFAAREEAYRHGQQMAGEQGLHVWDVQYVDYHNSPKRNRDGTITVVYEVDINEINKL